MCFFNSIKFGDSNIDNLQRLRFIKIYGYFYKLFLHEKFYMSAVFIGSSFFTGLAGLSSVNLQRRLTYPKNRIIHTPGAILPREIFPAQFLFRVFLQRRRFLDFSSDSVFPSFFSIYSLDQKRSSSFS